MTPRPDRVRQAQLSSGWIAAIAALLDTGVFIEAHRRYWYRQDICPGFWDALLHYQGAGRLVSLDRCRDEIKEGDALTTWIGDAPAALFVSTADVAAASGAGLRIGVLCSTLGRSMRLLS